MRIGIVWPRPRKDRWLSGQTDPANFPDLSDAFAFLRDEGIEPHIEDSLGLPWNPLARMHELYSGLDPLRAARALWRRYDAIVSVGCASGYLLAWMRRVIAPRVPIVVIDPALSHDYPRRKKIQNDLLPRAEKVVVFGRSQIDYLRAEYGDRVDAVFIPHRADTEFYRPAPEGTPRAEPPYLFSIGNDYSRDFATLTQAVGLLRARPGFSHRCLIHTALAVPETAGVEVCRDRVSFPQMRELYRRADLVVLPLRDMIHAGGINSLLEAMAVGRPVIVSASRGIADYVQDGTSARVVPAGDPAALAAAINDLLARPAEAARLGDGARRFTVETCHNRVYARHMAAVIRAAVEKRAAARRR